VLGVGPGVVVPYGDSWYHFLKLFEAETSILFIYMLRQSSTHKSTQTCKAKKLKLRNMLRGNINQTS